MCTILRNQFSSYRLWLIALLSLSAMALPAEAKRLGMNELPLPVQAYVLKSALEAGVANPMAIKSNEDVSFDLPGVDGSDINSDGKRDYAVNRCMFDADVQQFKNNGSACGVGNLIISNYDGGYDFMEIFGKVVAAGLNNGPAIVIEAENNGVDCPKKYDACEYAFRIARSARGEIGFATIKMCPPNECRSLVKPIASATLDWEGLWAVENPKQCDCRTYAIDMCPAGRGLPPVKIDRKELVGPEISCDITGHEILKADEFRMIGKCSAEGDEAHAVISGTIIDGGRLFLSITGPINMFWSQGDYTKFGLKCPSAPQNQNSESSKAVDHIIVSPCWVSGNGVWLVDKRPIPQKYHQYSYEIIRKEGRDNLGGLATHQCTLKYTLQN